MIALVNPESAGAVATALRGAGAVNVFAILVSGS
jgi:hypothetical protein